jgi:hypothetical protein
MLLRRSPVFAEVKTGDLRIVAQSIEEEQGFNGNLFRLFYG